MELRIPHEVVNIVVDRYIHFHFGRGVTESNGDHDTPLMEAACNGDITSVFILLLHARLYLSNESEIEAAAAAAAAKAYGTKEATTIQIRNIQQEFMDSSDDRSNTSLHAAAGGGHPEILKLILESCSWTGLTRATPNVNAQNSQGMTPLHWAAFFGHTDAVRLLLKAGANLEACDDKKRTPLSSSAMSDVQDSSTIRLLVDSGANILHSDERGKTPLHLAVVCDKESSVRALVELEPKGLDVLDEHGFTPFATACFKGTSENIVRFLYESGSNVNTTDADGRTPLHTASQRGNVRMLRLLARDFQADVNTVDKSGWTPLQTALVRYQAAGDNNNNNNNDEENEATNESNDELVELLVKSGANIEMKFRGNAMNTLHIAVQQSRLSVVSMLLEHARRQRRNQLQNTGEGEDEDRESGDNVANGKIPPAASVKKAHSDEDQSEDDDEVCIADYIQSKEQNHGYTALHFAAMFCTGDVGRDIVKLLVKAGADIGAKSHRGITPLQISQAIENDSVAGCLLDLKKERAAKEKEAKASQAKKSIVDLTGSDDSDDDEEDDSDDDSTPNEPRRKRARLT